MMPGLLLLGLLGAAPAGELPPTWDRVKAVRAEEGFVLPSATERRDLADLCRDLVRLAPMGLVPTDAAARAAALGYGLERSEGRLWLQDDGRRGGVVLGLSLGPLDHEVVLQAPHPFFDLDTGRIAAQTFDELPVRAVLIATAHRRDADGSDAAHSPEGAFTAATQGLVEGLGRPLVVQLHGFTADESRPARTYVSGGRSWWRTEGLSSARAELAVALGGVTVEAGDPSNGLMGQTNTQARLLEGQAPVLLVELDRELRTALRKDAEARRRLLEALVHIAKDAPGTAP